MKAVKVIFVVLAMMLAFGTLSYAAVDTKQFNTGYFAPDEASTYNSPYYRYYNQDWGWSHGALSAISSANLFIAAWDVDASSGEIDNIYVMDSGSWVNVGALAGLDGAWGFTTFNLGSNFFDDIATGLQVKMDIDSTHTSNYWAVALSKSVLTTDGSSNPNNPNPGTQVPEPATMLLLGLGLAGLAGLRRK